MLALNETSALWTNRLQALLNVDAPGPDPPSPDCCWFYCNLCCWVLC